MLTLTENASALIKNLADQTTQADDAGLRISAEEEGKNLSVDILPAPEPADQVIESAGARVFLEESAAVILDDKILDAQVDESGAIRFAIAQA